MLGLRDLDLMDTYNPNVDDIQESAEITYESANSFFSSNELNLKELVRLLKTGELSSPKEIYAKKRTAVSMLAECCEMYLKALFLYENKDSGKTCKELWTILEAKTKEDKNRKDRYGNVIYYQTEKDNETPLKHPDGTIIYVYAKVDSTGNIVNDTNGNPIYVDKLGKEYEYSRKGRAVKTNGHSLDRLVELLSPESRLLLETRMLTIPMNLTEKNGTVSILDVLQNKGLLSTEEHISKDQFDGWLDLHKRSFEEARYPGQKKYDINIEFMHHLETQIKAVVQYSMAPTDNQKFTITDEEIKKLPTEIRQLASFHSGFISEELIKLIASDVTIKQKIIDLFSQNYILPNNISASDFYNLIKKMETKEILYISYICYLVKNYLNLNFANLEKDNSKNKETYQAVKIAGILREIKFNPSKIVGFFIQLKTAFNMPINGNTITKLFDLLKEKFGYDPYEIKFNEYDISKNKKIISDYKNINNYKYKI